MRGDRVVARLRTGALEVELGDAPAPAGPIVLRIETRPHPHGPDMIVLGIEDESEDLHEVGEVDGRHLSTEMTGGFLGRVLGVYAVGGDASFDWFELSEAGPEGAPR